MKNCLFCQIASHQIPSDIVFEDDQIIAFNDIHPKAPVHILVIPKKHIPTIDHLQGEDSTLVAKLVFTAQKLARDKNINQDGYRLVYNVRGHGGQEIDHLHLHLIGGQKLSSMA